MVKLGKRKMAELTGLGKRKLTGSTESDENTKNEGSAGNSADDTNDVNKEVRDKNATPSKKQKPSATNNTNTNSNSNANANTSSTKSSASYNNSDDSDDSNDDLPLNKSSSAGSSASPLKKQKKATKAKATAVSTSAKIDNRNTIKKAAEKSSADEENSENDVVEYEVEAIVGHKLKSGESHFLVRWKGYGADDDTWEPEVELNCNELIEEYRKNEKSKSKTSVSPKKSSVSNGSSKRKSKGGKATAAANKVESDPNKEWVVERIVDYVDDDEQGGLYRIRWKGFGPKDDTWEPETNLSCEGLIERFKKNLKTQFNVDMKHLRESPKKTKRLVNETIPRTNLHNRVERSSKRAAAKNRVFYGEE